MYPRLVELVMHLKVTLNFWLSLPPPSKFWEYRHVPPGPDYVVQEQTQGFVHARWALYQKIYIPNPALTV